MAEMWTRHDFPADMPCPHMDHDSFICDEMRDVLAEWLNLHHPKSNNAHPVVVRLKYEWQARALKAEKELEEALSRLSSGRTFVPDREEGL